MAAVTMSDGRELSEQEQVEALVRLGVGPETAQAVVAMAAGRVVDDVLLVDDAGRLVPRETPPPTIVPLGA